MKVDFRVYLITDRKRTRGDLLEAVEKALKAGLKAVQLREKDLPIRQLYQYALSLRELTGRYNARLLINDRIDVAMATGADGVHLGRDSIPIGVARRLLGDDSMIGYSSHTLSEALWAEQEGADFVTFSPVYETASKPGVTPQGLKGLTEVTQNLSIPVFALGGITPERLQEVMNTGVHGVAVVSAILGAEDPAEETNKFVRLEI